MLNFGLLQVSFSQWKKFSGALKIRWHMGLKFQASILVRRSGSLAILEVSSN